MIRCVAVLVSLRPSWPGRMAPSSPPAVRPTWTGPSTAAIPKGNQYSPLAQIHAANVHRLERAWEYKTGDANQRSTMHANPIVVDGVMYVTTPSLKAVALNAATGKEIWVVRPRQIQQRQRGPAAEPRRRATGRGPGASGSSTSCAIASTRWTRRPAR